MTGQLVWFAYFVGLSLYLFYLSRRARYRWLRFLFGAFLIPNSLFTLVIAYAIYDSFQAGCWSAPKDVEFQQSMTLCPGQTAHGVIKLGNSESQ